MKKNQNEPRYTTNKNNDNNFRQFTADCWQFSAEEVTSFLRCFKRHSYCLAKTKVQNRK